MPLRTDMSSDHAGYSRFEGGRAAPLSGMDTEHRPAGHPWGVEPVLNVRELAAYVRVSVSTIYGWRIRSLDPQTYSFGKYLLTLASTHTNGGIQQRCACLTYRMPLR